MKSEGPFTVFAPTDDAFAKLLAGTIEALLNDIPALTDILLYHVIPGKVLAADVVNLNSASTALGEDVTTKVEGDKVMVNDAQVIISDIEASNGVIHVIDAVILPSAEPVVLPAVGGAAPTSNVYLVLLALGAVLVVSGLALRQRMAQAS